MTAHDLSQPQADLVREVRRLARERFAPLVASAPEGRVNRPLLLALGEDLLKRVFPRDGEGRPSAMDLCLLREALATECTAAETALALQGLGAHPIAHSGSESLRRRWLPRVARGEAVAAFALSEPDAGSDPAALALEARPDDAGWRLTGEKTWISNAPEADVYCVFARTSPDGARGVTAFVVPGASAGLSGEHIEMLAPHAIGRLRFDGVRVPADHVLGEVGAGFKVAMATLDLYRPSVGAFAVGMSQSALEASLAHANRREQGGTLLRNHQAVAHQLADMATLTEAARALVYHAASRHDARALARHDARALARHDARDLARHDAQALARHDAGGERNTRLAAMAKLFATEAAQRVVDMAVQVHGAQGLVKGHLVEHLYREVRAPRIYEGTSEIQRSIIARELYR